MKRRLLFVDDEEHILDGLRRMLRPMRGQWDMVFAGSGEEALAIMEETPFDVVISDMRMPEMDGAQLLSEVQKRHPEAARIILSGYAAKESVLRTVGPTHQYLAKPCDPRELVARLRAGSCESLHLPPLFGAPSIAIEAVDRAGVVEFDLRAGVLSKENSVAFLDVERQHFAVFRFLPSADCDNLALLRFLLGRIGNNDSTLNGFFLFDSFDQESIMKRPYSHIPTSFLFPYVL